MSYLILCFVLIFVGIAWSPDAVTQTVLAAVWLIFAMYVAAEILYYSSRFFLSFL